MSCHFEAVLPEPWKATCFMLPWVSSVQSTSPWTCKYCGSLLWTTWCFPQRQSLWAVFRRWDQPLWGNSACCLCYSQVTSCCTSCCLLAVCFCPRLPLLVYATANSVTFKYYIKKKKISCCSEKLLFLWLSCHTRGKSSMHKGKIQKKISENNLLWHLYALYMSFTPNHSPLSKSRTFLGCA